MNKKLFLAALFLVSSTTAFAQNTSVSQIEKSTAVSSEGFRVSLLRSNLSMKINADYGDEKVNETYKIDQTVGLSLGYVSLPIQQLGWTASLAALQLAVDEDELSMLRADGNVGYAINSYFNIKAGLNISNIKTNDSEASFKPDIGTQAGIGFQFNKNFGLDINYVITKQFVTVEKKFNNVVSGKSRFTPEQTGTEIALTGTF